MLNEQHFTLSKSYRPLQAAQAICHIHVQVHVHFSFTYRNSTLYNKCKEMKCICSGLLLLMHTVT